MPGFHVDVTEDRLLFGIGHDLQEADDILADPMVVPELSQYNVELNTPAQPP